MMLAESPSTTIRRTVVETVGDNHRTLARRDRHCDRTVTEDSGRAIGSELRGR